MLKIQFYSILNRSDFTANFRRIIIVFVSVFTLVCFETTWRISGNTKALCELWPQQDGRGVAYVAEVKTILGAALAAAMIAVLGAAAAEAASDGPIHVAVGATARAPIG